MLLPEVATKLVAAGLVPSSFTLIQGVLPDSPDQVIVLYETGGYAPDLFLNDGSPVENAGLQVVARGAAQDYATPRVALEAIYQGVLGLGGFTVSGTNYISVTPFSSVMFFRRDTNERVHFSVNFVIRKELS